MKPFVHISSVLFLCLYSLILSHSMIPHEHGEDLIDVHNEVSHHDDHHHGDHQHGDEPESQCLLGFIMDFLGGLDHESIGEEHISPNLGNDVNLQIALADIFPILSVEFVGVLLEKPKEVSLQEFALPPPRPYHVPDLGTTSQRGPPFFFS